MDRERPHRKSKGDRSDRGQRSVTANKKELAAIKSRNKKWARVDQDRRPGVGQKGRQVYEQQNALRPHRSRCAYQRKAGQGEKAQLPLPIERGYGAPCDHRYQGVPCRYEGQPTVTGYRDASARTVMEGRPCVWGNCVADTGYSSGEKYAFLENSGIKSYIPPHGTYKGGPDGFEYDGTADRYPCSRGKVIPFKKVFLDHRTKTKKKAYRASSKTCKGCPLRATCLGKVKEKQSEVTYYRAEYERNIARFDSREGRYMKGKRQSTVEPVFGTLTQFMGLRKISTIGLEQANKVMRLSAIAYNLKKYLKFEQKRAKSRAGALAPVTLTKNLFRDLLRAFAPRRKMTFQS